MNEKKDNQDQYTEVCAHITVPTDGGWGWVVVTASFFSIFFQNGISYSFGSLLQDISNSLEIDVAAASIVGSFQCALYYLFCPLGAALINRFGFRVCAMVGSILSAFGSLIGSLSESLFSLIIFSGILCGTGLAFMNMASLLVVGFYFEKRRSIAIAIATTGASCGLMCMYPLNSYLVSLTGWRPVVLLHAGMFGSIYFMSLTYRPLLSLTLHSVREDNTQQKVVTIVPSINDEGETSQASKAQASKVERFLGAVSNTRFPTAAQVIQDSDGIDKKQSKFYLSEQVIINPNVTSFISARQLARFESSVASLRRKNTMSFQILAPANVPKKRKWWQKCCFWEKEPVEERPLYRDDTFYTGRMSRLPQYQKSMLIPEAERSGLEYQLTVTRAVPVTDAQDKQGLCTKAFKRVLSTMLDFSKLLKIPSFAVFCFSAFLSYLGLLVPYVYLTDRNKAFGLDSHYFVSIVAFSTTFCRLGYALIAEFISSVRLYAFALMLGGISTIFSDYSYTFNFQYAYCAAFGCSVSGAYSLKCICLVDLYGLENLTNATGLTFLFVGLGSLFSPPLAALVINNFGYAIAFRIGGGLLFISGLLVAFHRIPAVK